MKKPFKAVSKDLRMTRPPRMEARQQAAQRNVRKPKRRG